MPSFNSFNLELVNSNDQMVSEQDRTITDDHLFVIAFSMSISVKIWVRNISKINCLYL